MTDDELAEALPPFWQARFRSLMVQRLLPEFGWPPVDNPNRSGDTGLDLPAQPSPTQTSSRTMANELSKLNDPDFQDEDDEHVRVAAENATFGLTNPECPNCGKIYLDLYATRCNEQGCDEQRLITR